MQLRNPYIQQWNLTLEQEVASVGLRLSYIGTNSRKLNWVQNVNQPPPSLTKFTNDMRRFPNLRNILVRDNGGLYYQAGWTWSSMLTDCQSDSEGGCTPQDAYARHLDYGNADYMNRHRFVGSLLYELPIGQGRPFLSNMPRAAEWVLGGWTLSSILVAQSGLYFEPSFSGFDVSNTGTTGTQRLDRIGNGNLPSSQRPIDKWFDNAAFVVPGDVTGDGQPDVNVGRFGNAAPNILQGPKAFILDTGLYKTFRFTERVRAHLEGTFTNVLNHPNYGLPNGNIRSGSVGRITSLYNRYGAGSRNGRVGLRIEF